MPGTDVDPHLPGAPCWFEAVTRDVGRSAAFYCDLFGWTSQVASAGSPGYVEFRRDGRLVAGLLPTLNGLDVPPHWGVYFTAADVDATVQRATDLGGTVCRAPREIPGVGRFAALRSPQGVAFHVVQYGV